MSVLNLIADDIEREYLALVVAIADEKPPEATAIRKLLAEAGRTLQEVDNHASLLTRLRGYMAALSTDKAADETSRVAHEAIEAADARLEADLESARRRHYEACQPHRLTLSEVQRCREKAADARREIQASKERYGNQIVETLLATI